MVEVDGYFAYRCQITDSSYPFFNPYKSIMVSGVTVSLVLSPLIICLNILVAMAIMRKRRLRTASNMLLVSTAISDICVGMSSIPLFAANFFFAYSIRTHNCILYTSQIASMHYFSFVSFVLVMIIAIDRVLAVFKPFFYHDRIVARWRSYFYIAIIIWVLIAIFITIIVLLPAWFVLLYVEAAVFFVSSITSLATHTSIYLVVKRFRKTVPHGCAMTDTLNHKRERKQQMKDWKLSVLTFFMLISILVCYVPYSITGLMWLCNVSDDWLMPLNVWSFVMVTMKSLLNPILYCYSISIICKEVKCLLHLKKRDGSSDQTSSYKTFRKT